MPIYEYYCKPCNTIYQFLIKRVTPDTSPVCPKCGAGKLDRVMSRFSTPNTKSDGDEMDSMAGELAGLDENDPRAMARAVRKMADQMGEDLGPELEHALGRLEAGEDPEKIEQELEAMGFGDDGEPGGSFSGAPTRDSGLYEA
jgi:putative FmdB family regulatory protein